MGKKSKSKTELEAELRAIRASRTTEAVTAIATTLIRWGAIVLIARYGYLAIDSLSGKATLADIGISFLSEVKVSVILSWVAGGGGVIYGLRQRKLRKDTVQSLQGRIQQFEKELDPRRSTSSLTERGDTREEDKV